jgi:tryptophan synthase alpha chain
MSKISRTFEKLKSDGRKALIPFITAGYPDLNTTEKFIYELEKSGADLIELGVPFSDPMADGPTIQAASERALAAGTTLKGVLQLVTEVRKTTQIPLVLMGYYNPVFHYGVEDFASDAASAGVDALLLVDLPPEEVAEIHGVMSQAGIDLITLLAPTTPHERMARLSAVAEGYLYYVSMTGVTGAQKISPEDIRVAVEELKGMTDIPVAVGFGITTAADAKAVGAFADGVIVGSALVKIIAEYGQSEKLLPEVTKFIAELKHGLTASAS